MTRPPEFARPADVEAAIDTQAEAIAGWLAHGFDLTKGPFPPADAFVGVQSYIRRNDGVFPGLYAFFEQQEGNYREAIERALHLYMTRLDTSDDRQLERCGQLVRLGHNLSILTLGRTAAAALHPAVSTDSPTALDNRCLIALLEYADDLAQRGRTHHLRSILDVASAPLIVPKFTDEGRIGRLQHHLVRLIIMESDIRDVGDVIDENAELITRLNWLPGSRVNLFRSLADRFDGRGADILKGLDDASSTNARESLASELADRGIFDDNEAEELNKHLARPPVVNALEDALSIVKNTPVPELAV